MNSNELAQELTEWREFTDEVITAMLADGTDKHAEYALEHHLVGADFDALEKVVIDAFKAGFEVDDAEELEDEEGLLFCSAAYKNSGLDADLIMADIEQLLHICSKHDVIYDGWGTQFIEPNAT